MTPSAATPGWTRLAADWADQPVTVEHSATNGGVTTAAVHARDQRLFCKTAPQTDPAAVQLLRIEAVATTAHAGAAAPFHGLHQGHGWEVLIFDYVKGTPARFHPPATGFALSEHIADLVKTPQASVDTSFLPAIPERIDTSPAWKELLHEHPWLLYAAAADFLVDGQADRMRHLAGNHIAHTDIHPHNIILTEETITVVDWGSAATAPPWFDQAIIGIQLISAGVKPGTMAASVCSERTGHPCTPDELCAFAVEMARYWIGRYRRNPETGNLLDLAAAANRLAVALDSPEIVRSPAI